MQDSQRKFVADDSFLAGDTDPDQQQAETVMKNQPDQIDESPPVSIMIDTTDKKHAGTESQ